MYKSIKIIPKLDAIDHPFVQDIIAIIKQAAEQCHVTINKFGGTRDTLFIAVGGDGTMLEAMREASLFGGAAFAINLGHVGFLTEVSIPQRDVAMSNIVQAELFGLIVNVIEQTGTWEEERILLTGKGFSDREAEVVACNEFSISRDVSDSMIFYRLFINNIDGGVHRANSLVISTPTGSTAYSLSGGGALMFPNIEAFQIVPIAPMTMTARPIIVGGKADIKVHVWGGNVVVRADGRICSEETAKDAPSAVEYSFTNGDKTRVIHFDGWNFFEVLADKFGWNKF